MFIKSLTSSSPRYFIKQSKWAFPKSLKKMKGASDLPRPIINFLSVKELFLEPKFGNRISELELNKTKATYNESKDIGQLQK